MITWKEESARFRAFSVQFLLMAQQYSPTDSKRALINLKNMTDTPYIAGSSPTKDLLSKPNDDDDDT